MTDKEQLAKKIIQELPTALLRWYPFAAGTSLVYIGEEDSIWRMLQEEKKLNCVRVSAGEEPAGEFDYAVCIGAFELLPDASAFFKRIRTHLKDDGLLLLGCNNRLGIRYFCGDRDLYTQRNFDGIENYTRAYSNDEDVFGGRAYDPAQIRTCLDECGLTRQKYYSVFPDLENPIFLYAEGFVPNEDLSCRFFPEFHYPQAVFLEEPRMYQTLLENGLFLKMANAFFVECAASDLPVFADALHVTSSLRRGTENALITVIHEDRTVTKQAAYPDGTVKIKQLAENEQLLNRRGIKTVGGKLEGDAYRMPYIDAETGQAHLKNLLLTDPDAFLREMDSFRDLILRSSDSYEGTYMPELNEEEIEKSKKKKLDIIEENKNATTLLKHAFLDLVPLNSFYINGEYVFFDQEFCEPDYPQAVLLDRMISTFYTGNGRLGKIISHEELQKRYGIFEEYRRWHRLENRFIHKLRNDTILREHDASVRARADAIHANRQRLNYSADDYQRLFIDIFEYADSRKLILFGSGLFARRFLALYGEDYPVYAVVDNNESRWGQKLYPEGYDPENNDMKFSQSDAREGVEIHSPNLLQELRHGEYKVLICIKNYLSVMNQLDALGIREYSIFDPAKAYVRKRHPINAESALAFDNSTVPTGGKKYHVGYIAGVFDLYHVGHLNMFRHAKEMCDYLIVGVVSDEGVKRFKKVQPFVPFAERIEMVASCRYVDEAVEIPYLFNGSQDAWRMHHFDVQFSGSDYLNDPGFENYKKFLEEHGATLEFFPYTQSTSSTQLRKLIEKKLL